jgi:hypothetical protein
VHAPLKIEAQLDLLTGKDTQSPPPVREVGKDRWHCIDKCHYYKRYNEKKLPLKVLQFVTPFATITQSLI